MFQYRAFGLNIESELELFQLAKGRSSDNKDITIRIGSVPENGINPQDANAKHCQYHQGQLWININETVRFLVSEGQSILVDVLNNTDLQTVKLYLLGSAMGAILQQRGYLVLHGNVIRFNDFAIIVVAQSGVGKSTLAAEFFRRGYQLLADDVCAIDQHGFVHSSYPYVKLWQQSLDALDLEQRDIIKIRLQNEKFYYPLNDSFCQTSLPVGAIYVLNKGENDDFIIQTLNGITKLNALQNNKYRAFYATKMNIDHDHILTLSTMLKTVPVTRIIRPDNGFKIEALAQHIIDKELSS